MAKLGIAHTKALVGLALSMGNALGQSLVDGKVTLGDLHNFVGPLLGIGDVLSGAADFLPELADLDQAESDELFAYAKETFKVPEDKVQDTVQAALTVAAELVDLIFLVKSNLSATAAA